MEVGRKDEMDTHSRNRTTEVEVPPGAILFDVPDPDTKADWTQEDENAYFAKYGWCSLRGLAAIQAQAVEVHESFESAKAAIEAAGGTLVQCGERPIEGPEDVAKAVENNRRIVRRITAWTHSRTAVPRPALLVRRTTPRRLAVRRHRRAATRAPAAASDDGNSPDPPPEKLAVVAACAALAAGFAVGAIAATVLP